MLALVTSCCVSCEPWMLWRGALQRRAITIAVKRIKCTKAYHMTSAIWKLFWHQIQQVSLLFFVVFELLELQDMKVTASI